MEQQKHQQCIIAMVKKTIWALGENTRYGALKIAPDIGMKSPFTCHKITNLIQIILLIRDLSYTKSIDPYTNKGLSIDFTNNIFLY